MLIYLCSPYGEKKENFYKTQRLLEDIFEHGNMAFAAHLWFPLWTTDRIEGMRAGLKILSACDEVWVYGKPSVGMREEINYAKTHGIPVVYKEESDDN